MQHVLYSDGNSKKISWTVQSDGKIVEQNRTHADIYLDKVSNLQSKYVALHVGVFWCIGVFIIKNGDDVKIILDDKEMFEHLKNDKNIDDEFIEKRTYFLKKLFEQRDLKIQYELVSPDKNISTKLL